VSSSRARAAAGIVLVALSSLGFSAMAVFAHHAYAAGVDTATLLLLRFAIAGAVLWAVVLVRRRPLPSPRAALVLAGMGALGYAGQAFSFFTALSLGSAGLAALLLYTYPALVAILSRVVLRHPLTRVQVAAIGMSLAGSALTIGRSPEGSAAAVLFGLLAALIYANYIVVGSRLPAGGSASASSAVVISAAAAVYAVVGLARGVHLPQTAAGWLAILGIAVIGTAVAIGFFLASLDRLGPVRASVYSTLEPAFTLLLAWLFLGETVSAPRLAGGALICAAVVVLARADAARARAPAEAA
jgi:drug/metabolite transporter (DMT)-like permease